MPKRAAKTSKQWVMVATRLTAEELQKFDELVEKMRLRFPKATRSSVIRTMMRKYVSAHVG